MEKFGYAMFLANTMYDLHILPEDFEEIGLVAWNMIGNKNCRLYKTIADVDCKTGRVKLPCNCDIIEAVTYPFEDWEFTSNIYVNGDINSGWIEQFIESRKRFTDPLYVGGRYVKYTQDGDVLYLDQKGIQKVAILYKGVLMDEEGLPSITLEEATAIATFVAWNVKFKEALKTNNKDTLGISQALESRWYRLCDAARVPSHISQNEMNEILDAKTSWNRKIFNKSYKPLR